MRFYTAEILKTERVMVSFDGGCTAYSLKELGFPYDSMNTLIAEISDAQKEYLRSFERKSPDAVPTELSSLHLLAPIPKPKQDIICLGINYSDHAAEAGKFSAEAFGGERPYTIYFSKRCSEAPGPGAAIPSYPGLVDSLDYEVELGVVIGEDVKGISADNALSAVFGYTIINDVSARNLQTRHKQWYLGKSLDGFAPMGPCIVTPDEIGDAAALNISCRVNGELRQSSNTKHMIQTVDGAISELSAGMTLSKGTIIATGTPSGVGMGMEPPCFLKTGDTVSCEIEKIGVLSNIVE